MQKQSARLGAISPVEIEIIEKVMAAACIYFNVTKDMLINEYRLANARHLCFYIIINSTDNVRDYNVGQYFNRKRTAVQYGVGLIDSHKNTYRQTLGDLNGIIGIVNNFEKKYKWDLPLISTTR